MQEEQNERAQDTDKKPIVQKAIGFPCLQCGNQMSFSPERGQLYCSYCKTEKEIPDKEIEAAEYMYFPEDEHFEAPVWENEPGQVLTCPSCGADTVLGAAAMTATCPFCSSHYVTEAPADKAVISPETMIPFRISEAAAGNSFTEWVKKQWLAPRKFKKEAKKPEMKGIYIPFGGKRRIEHYTVRVNGKTQTRTRTRTDWYPIGGQMHLDFDNIPCPATKKIDRALLDKLGGYSLKVLNVYNPAYLAGFLAERYSIGISDGFDIVRKTMELRMANHIQSSLHYDTYRGMQYNHHYEAVKFKHILLPLWLAAYSFHGKVYQFMVNGETGRSAGRAPLSALKIALLIGGGILAAGLLLFLLMSLGQ